jgi:hypothetical protein
MWDVTVEYQFGSKILDSLSVRSRINARNWINNIGGCWIDDRVLEMINGVAKTAPARELGCVEGGD